MSGPPAAIPRETEHAAASVLEALDLHLRHAPEDPALFYPDGLDVRWRSWRALAEQARSGAVALTAAGVGPGDGVAFRWRCAPDAVAADLAVLGAGGSSAPVAGPADPAAAGCAAWLLQPGEPPPETTLPVVALPEAQPPWARRSEAAPSGFPAPAGGAARVVEGGGGAGGGPGVRELSAEEVLAGARELGARLRAAVAAAEAGATVGRPRRGREIALASFDLRTRGGRGLLTWALVTGAALFLEPDPRALPGSTAWARPTLVAADAAPLVELARQIRRREQGRLRRLRRRRGPPHPFGRLRLVIVLGGGRLPVDDVPFWAERGVVVLRA